MDWPPDFKSELESFQTVVEEARIANRERTRLRNQEQFGDYWASKQDEPPEWWDEDEK